MAVKPKVKTKEHENLTEANVKRVIELLEGEKPISKKVACEILNISYNTTRLTKIIDTYKDEQAELERRRALNRGKPASEYEIQMCIEGYLDGDPVAAIAKRLFRPPTFVKEIIDRVGVPQRVVGAEWNQPGIIPDQCIRESFEPGQIVWHARRHCMGIVTKELKSSNDVRYYRVFIIETIEEPSPFGFLSGSRYGGHYAGAHAFDLGSLDHLKQYGVDVYRPYRQDFASLGLKET